MVGPIEPGDYVKNVRNGKYGIVRTYSEGWIEVEFHNAEVTAPRNNNITQEWTKVNEEEYLVSVNAEIKANVKTLIAREKTFTVGEYVVCIDAKGASVKLKKNTPYKIREIDGLSIFLDEYTQPVSAIRLKKYSEVLDNLLF